MPFPRVCEFQDANEMALLKRARLYGTPERKPIECVVPSMLSLETQDHPGHAKDRKRSRRQVPFQNVSESLSEAPMEMQGRPQMENALCYHQEPLLVSILRGAEGTKIV